MARLCAQLRNQLLCSNERVAIDLLERDELLGAAQLLRCASVKQCRT